MSITGLSSVISESTLHELQRISLQFEGAGSCLDGHSLLLNSWETRADGTPSLSQIEALRPIRRCATDTAVIGIAFFGCVVWSRGTCRIQTSLCVSADYIWPGLRRFSVHPPAYASS